MIDALEAQLAEILRGAPSNASSMATATGVKDKYFQHFADELAAACAQVKEQQRNDPSLSGAKHLTDKLKELRERLPFDIFSPSLRLDGRWMPAIFQIRALTLTRI